MLFQKQNKTAYIVYNLKTILGIILIWRGVWYILDACDMLLFGKSHELTALGGIIFGFALLYLPNRNLKALERL